MSSVRSALLTHARGAGWVLAATALVGLTACAPQSSSTTSASTTSATTTPAAATTTADPCAKESLALKSAGTLTIGTDSPAYSPWFVDDDPTNGKGYESAVAYAVANKLGFTNAEVKWVKASFNSSFAPGPKTFDFFINQVSITAKRAKSIDFTPGYYDVAQAVITTKKSKAAGAKSIADLAGVKFGAQVGTTSYDAIKNQIKPTSEAAVFNTNDDAVKALENGQIDAIVVDLPTALYLTAAVINGGVLVGQLPNVAGTPEQFGLVLEKGSAFTACASSTVDALKADGTLAKLQGQWLTDAAGAPVLS